MYTIHVNDNQLCLEFSYTSSIVLATQSFDPICVLFSANTISCSYADRTLVQRFCCFLSGHVYAGLAVPRFALS